MVFFICGELSNHMKYEIIVEAEFDEDIKVLLRFLLLLNLCGVYLRCTHSQVIL